MEHEKGTYDPPMGILYGKSGGGKTVDLGFSFSRFLFIAAPGALSSIKSTCGYTPAQAFAPDLDEALKIIQQNKKNNAVKGIVFDDFCWICEKQLEKLRKKGITGFALWGKLKESVARIRDTARTCGFAVFFNCWEGPPKLDKTGEIIRGGPSLSGKLPEEIASLCDIVLRCGINSMAPHGRWKGIYRCHLDSKWVMKDRFNVGQRMEELPQNVGEILRAGGWRVERHHDLEWQEDMVETLSEQMLTGDPNLLYTNTLSALSKKVGYPVAYWTVRDAYDRHIIKRGLALS